MADYIEVHSELVNHPKMDRLRRILKMPAVYMVGHLTCLWHWAMDYAPNGDLSRYDDLDIAAGAKWEGDPTEFVEALVNSGPGGAAGFLERSPNGKLLIHDWHHYGGKLLIIRFKDSFRKTHGRQPTFAEIKAAGLFPPEMWHGMDEPATDNGDSSGSVAFPADSNGFQRIPADSNVEERSVAKRSVEQRSVEERRAEQSRAADADAPPLPEKDMPGSPLSREEKEAAARAAVEARCKASPALWGVIQAAEDRAREAKRRISSLWVWRLGVLDTYDREQRERPPENRDTRPELRPIPPDWLPGVTESEARKLCRDAVNGFKARGRPGPYPDAQICDEARRLWRIMHPDDPVPWTEEGGEESDADPPPEPTPPPRRILPKVLREKPIGENAIGSIVAAQFRGGNGGQTGGEHAVSAQK